MSETGLEQKHVSDYDHYAQTSWEDRPDCREDLDHLQYYNPETQDTATFRCDQWECRCCGHRMKMNLLEEIDRVVEARPELSRMLTLTIDPKQFTNAEYAHRQLGKYWNRLRNALNHKYGDFSYIWVREEQKNGYPHLHILISRYIPQEQVQRLWEQTGAGSIVDIRQVEARKAGNYIAKYLAKQAMMNIPSGVNRYGCSSDISLNVRDSGDDEETSWELIAFDPVTETWTEAAKADFHRREGLDPPPLVPPS